MELTEVPGAMERPSGCHITVSEEGGIYRIDIPAHGASPVMWLGATGLAVGVAAWIVMGAAFLFFGKAVLLMAWICSGGVPSGLRRYAILVAPIWLSPLWFASMQLLHLLKPFLTREVVSFGPADVRHTRLFLGRRTDRAFPYSSVRSFVFAHDPQGFTHGVLHLVAQSERCPVAEYVSDSDREWLASVGNTLLRRLA